MPSRDIRRAQNKKGETVSETIEKRKNLHPALYGFSIVVLVVIVVTFVAAGPGGPMSRGGAGGSGSIVFGSYEGREISYYQGSYFAQERDRLANQVRNDASKDTRATAQMVWYQAFINTAEHVAILLQAERAGVQVSEDAIDKTLLAYPGYLDENGKFSEARFRAASAGDHAATRKLTRESMMSNIFVSDVMYGLKNGTQELEFVKAMAGAERSFTFASWPFASYPVEEVRAYGNANAPRFVKMKLSRILVKSGESQAAEIRRKILDKTSTFEELAKTYSKDDHADKGGDMGWRYAYDVEADFESKDAAQKVFALKMGELSDVLKGTFGWLIYRADSESTTPDFASATILEDVKNYLTRYEKGKIEDYFNAKAGQLAQNTGALGFEKATQQAGIKAISTEFFPINLGSVFSFAPVRAIPDAETPTNAIYSEDFFLRAFSLGKDQVSAPVVLDDRVLVLKLKGERKLPDTTAALLGSWISYIASQSVQVDLGAALMTPDKLTDSFAATFDRYVMPVSSNQ